MPTYKLSKWLVNEYKNLPIKVDNLEVENLLDFVNKVNNIELEDGEILVSFDLYLLELLNLNKIDDVEIAKYKRLLCSA